MEVDEREKAQFKLKVKKDNNEFSIWFNILRLA